MIDAVEHYAIRMPARGKRWAIETAFQELYAIRITDK